MVAMITPPSVMGMNERRNPVPKNRRRIQASVRSSNVIAASASSTAAWYWGMRNGSVCRTPPRNVPEPVIAPYLYAVWTVVACCAAVLAGVAAAGPEARSGPKRNSVPQVTAPTPKMAAPTQNPVV